MTNKIYVGNISYKTQTERLSQLFKDFGTITSVNIITDRNTGMSKGFGFVEMSSEEEARAAIDALNGQEIDGRSIRVSEARERPHKNRNPGQF